MPRAQQARAWLFTSFHASSEQVRHAIEASEQVKYAIWQVEQCPETGRLHVQGYVEFKRPTRLAACKRAIGDAQAHVEQRGGTPAEARAYCSKEETRIAGPWEFGVFSGQGSRSDLVELHESLRTGKSLRAISNDHFEAFLRYNRGIQLYRLLNIGQRDWEMRCDIFYGPPGTGKSAAAHAIDPEAFRLPPQQTSSGCGWWDGYDGQETVIIDEFYGQLRWGFLLQLLDRYPLRVEYKGGSVPFVGRRVIFTSNKPPWEWYDYSKFDCGPLKRRITRIYHCVDNVFYVVNWP